MIPYTGKLLVAVDRLDVATDDLVSLLSMGSLLTIKQTALIYQEPRPRVPHLIYLRNSTV
jgi:hypothetical protein